MVTRRGFFCADVYRGEAVADRAVLFVDGNNWYHGLKELGLSPLSAFNYAKVSNKLVRPSDDREWTATRFYIGQVRQDGDLRLYAEQRRYVDWLKARDSRISVHFGRLERRSVRSKLASELKQYLGSLRVRIDPVVYKDLLDLAKQHEKAKINVEKAVDVMLAVDMVAMAMKDEYDVAYILSADGDYTHAAQLVSEHGKKVFAAAPRAGAQVSIPRQSRGP